MPFADKIPPVETDFLTASRRVDFVIAFTSNWRNHRRVATSQHEVSIFDRLYCQKYIGVQEFSEDSRDKFRELRADACEPAVFTVPATAGKPELGVKGVRRDRDRQGKESSRKRDK